MDQRRLDRLLNRLHRIDDEESVLQRICIVCVEVTAMAGAGVSRIVAGRHETLAASDLTAARVESLQVDLAEGPCLEAVNTLALSFEPDLSSPRAQRQWPKFSPAAVSHGVAATFAFPLITGGLAVGALDVYACSPGAMAREQVEDAWLLAGLAGLAVERADHTGSIPGVDLNAEPAEEWAHAAVVHNATGMVSEQLGVDVDQALLRLRAVAFATERRVSDVARGVVERTLRIDRWTDHE